MSEKISVITLLNGEKEFIPLIIDNYNNFCNHDNHKNYDQELELIIIDDGKENLSSNFEGLTNCIYIHLNKEEINKFMDQIEEGYKQPDKNLLRYQRLCKKLPKGFKRDYACGLSSHDYIFHMNIDCIYNQKAIERKINFMKRTNAECIYCDTTLAYDIYGKELYKTESPVKIYESTLFHTREFWKRKGFKWSDTIYEAKLFHYNNGVDRKMDNYYDTIQLLSVHNINQYKPIKITLENMNINIPELIHQINISEHPFTKYIQSIYDDQITILGLDSEYLEYNKDNQWIINNINEKWKQTKLSKMVLKFSDKFNILLYNSKQPAWDLFNNIQFDIILMETHKNYEQMTSIINQCKKFNYLLIDGIFVREDFLNQGFINSGSGSGPGPGSGSGSGPGSGSDELTPCVAPDPDSTS